MNQLEQLKEDLEFGKNLGKEKERNFQKYPEKTLYTIMKCLKENGNQWAKRSKILEQIEEDWELELYLKKGSEGRNLYDLEGGGLTETFNPSDWIGANLTMDEQGKNEATMGDRDTLERWKEVLERKKIGDHWAYKIRNEYWEKIAQII
jgi:hypothetical protein